MRTALRRVRLLCFAILCATGPVSSRAEEPYTLTIPALEYRTGPFASSGIGFWNGFRDYVELVNERDGGINGVKLAIVACETGYDPKVGIECYEKTKNAGASGALVYHPLSTAIAYQLIPRAASDRIPILSSGYGRASSADGRVFPWVFNFPASHWSAASIFVKYIGDREGGLERLSGKTIALVHLNAAFGREPILTLQALAKKHGFTLRLYPVDSPGQEQRATWLQVRREKPDWILLWGVGIMNQTAIREAAGIRFPMDRIIGIWWSASEEDVRPAGLDAHGYLGGALNAPGRDCAVHRAIETYVYDRGKAVDMPFRSRIGEVLYNRGLVSAMYTVEAIRNAMAIHGTTRVRGTHVRDGLETLTLTEERLIELGFAGLAAPIRVTCANHEADGQAAIQQWDAQAKRWTIVSRYYTPDRDVVGALVRDDAMAYAKENGITPVGCPS